MEASIVDLRYKTKNVLRSIGRNEDVKLLYHNKWIATIVPRHTKCGKKRIADHPFFGMHKTEQKSVDETMQELRGGRYR